MKHITREDADMLAEVAPHAGAWIETSYDNKTVYLWRVAPHAGAWIETYEILDLADGASSRPPRGGVD